MKLKMMENELKENEEKIGEENTELNIHLFVLLGIKATENKIIIEWAAKTEIKNNTKLSTSEFEIPQKTKRY